MNVEFQDGVLKVVLSHPRKIYGTTKDRASNDVEAEFSVTPKGFRCYASTEIGTDPANPDTPIFRGERNRPRYRIQVKL